MKTKSLLLTLLLLSFVNPTLASAQTIKAKKKTTTSKPPVNNATRSRRTDQSAIPTEPQPSAEVKPDATDKPKEETQTPRPENETAPAAQEPEPKSTEKSEPSSDPVVVLTEKIGAAETGVERIRLQLKLADELLGQGKKPEALTLLHGIAGTDVFDPQSFYNTGNALARLGDNDGAIKTYRTAIDQRKGGYSRALNNLGVVLLRTGRWEESHEALSSALKLENFRYPEASYNLGRLYAARGQTDLAVREWKRVLALDPKHAGAADALAHVRSGDSVAVEPTTTSASAKVQPAELAAKPGANSSSASTARSSAKALVLDAASYNYLERARSLNEKGNTSAAIESYQRLLGRQNGYFPVANLEISFALLSLKRYDEALSNLQLVAERDGARYPISYFHLARVYETKGDLKQAENWFARAVTAFAGKNNQFLLDVSRVREKQGDYSGALQAMEKYLSLMQQQGIQPAWSDERVTALKQKVAAKQ